MSNSVAIVTGVRSRPWWIFCERNAATRPWEPRNEPTRDRYDLYSVLKILAHARIATSKNAHSEPAPDASAQTIAA